MSNITIISNKKRVSKPATFPIGKYIYDNLNITMEQKMLNEKHSKINSVFLYS